MSTFVVQLLVALVVVGDSSSAAHPHPDPEPEERLEGWLAVTNNLTVHVAVGLLNRAEARPAAAYVDGPCVCVCVCVCVSTLHVCEHVLVVGCVTPPRQSPRLAHRPRNQH